MNFNDFYKFSSLISSKLGIRIPLPKFGHQNDPPDSTIRSQQDSTFALHTEPDPQEAVLSHKKDEAALSGQPLIENIADASQVDEEPHSVGAMTTPVPTVQSASPISQDADHTTKEAFSDYPGWDEAVLLVQDSRQETLATAPAVDFAANPDKEIRTDPDLTSENAEIEDLLMEYDHLPVAHYTQEQLAISKKKLGELMRTCSGLYGILIHTVDGHDLLDVLTRDLPAGKISTMTSSFLALGETIARESSQKICQYAMLENSNGRMISLRINEILMLTCISTKDSNPGMLLSTGKRTAEELSKILVSQS